MFGGMRPEMGKAMQTDAWKSRIVGMKQVLRALEADEVAAVYLADDAETRIRERVEAACAAHAVEVRHVPSMRELGRMCGIDVGAACAGEMRAR